MKKETKNLTKVILFTVGSTLIGICFLVLYLASVLVVLSPNTMTNVYDYLELDKAKTTVYRSAYERSQDVSDLYNLIQVSIDTENYDYTVRYAKTMLERKDFAKFAAKIDSVSTAQLSATYENVLASYESYLKNQLTVAMYKLNENRAEAFLNAIDSAHSPSGLNFELAAYVDCIKFDKTLSEDEKDAEYLRIYKYYFSRNDFQNLITVVTADMTMERADLPKLWLAKRINALEKFLFGRVGESVDSSFETAINEEGTTITNNIATIMANMA